jgi:hypothetical protein
MKFATRVAKSLTGTDLTGAGWDPAKHDIITLGKGTEALMGLILDETAVLVHHKRFQSYRIRRGNLGYQKHVQLFSYKRPIDKTSLSKYFQENGDNPYAVYYILSRMHYGRSVSKLTQFPPLYRERLDPATYIEKLRSIQKALEIGDTVCSRSADSPIGSLIRKEDQSQFNHMSLYFGDGMTVDATLKGVQFCRLSDGAADFTHYAFYRDDPPSSDDQKKKIKEFMIRSVQSRAGYNYKGLVELWLRKRLGLKARAPLLSISNLLYAYDFRLIAWI